MSAHAEITLPAGASPISGGGRAEFTRGLNQAGLKSSASLVLTWACFWFESLHCSSDRLPSRLLVRRLAESALPECRLAQRSWKTCENASVLKWIMA